jgi:hypothetical protein
MKIRVPSSSDLYELPALSSLLLLEISAVVAANALRAQHVQLEGDFHPGEPEDATTARILARECAMLRDTLAEYPAPLVRIDPGVLVRNDPPRGGVMFGDGGCRREEEASLLEVSALVSA